MGRAEAIGEGGGRRKGKEGGGRRKEKKEEGEEGRRREGKGGGERGRKEERIGGGRRRKMESCLWLPYLTVCASCEPDRGAMSHPCLHLLP